MLLPTAAVFVPSFLSVDRLFCHDGQGEETSRERRSSCSTNPVSARRLTTTAVFGVKVTLRIVGKRTGGEKWIDQGCQMYETRLKPNNIDLVTEWYKTNEALVKNVQADIAKSTPTILLDPTVGKQTSSQVFSKQFYQWAEKGGSRLVFVIGGAEGLPPELFTTASSSEWVSYWSLSQLTFTHQFARLLLFEQIYRASEIVRIDCI